jgi:hypothetical protein
MLPEFRREAQQAHDLSHTGTGYAFHAGDLCLVGNPAELQYGLPLDAGGNPPK